MTTEDNGSAADRVTRAFTIKPPSPKQRQMLQLILDHPGASSPTLSKMMGWTGNTWSMQFGRMVTQRAEHLGPARPSQLVSGATRHILILAEFNPETWAFTLRPEVVKGLAAIGIRPSSEG